MFIKRESLELLLPIPSGSLSLGSGCLLCLEKPSWAPESCFIKAGQKLREVHLRITSKLLHDSLRGSVAISLQINMSPNLTYAAYTVVGKIKYTQPPIYIL